MVEKIPTLEGDDRLGTDADWFERRHIRPRYRKQKKVSRKPV